MKSDYLKIKELCQMFDHTYLKAFARKEDFIKLCKEATYYNFAMVAINSYPVKLCKELLKGSAVRVGAAISFPLGQTTIETKMFETEKAIKDGADEIDYVVNIGELKNKNFEYIKIEMEKIVTLCRCHNAISKVIFENCYLNMDEITTLANIAKEVKPDFIKTSTGLGTSGAKVEDVKLMTEIVDGTVKVKASGGINSWETCKNMIEAGAKRIGTSNSITILKEYIESKEKKE